MIFFRIQNILPKIQCCSYRNLYYIFQTKYTWIKWKLQHYINNFYWLNFLHLSNMNHSVQNACKPQDLGHQWIQSNVPIHIMFFMFMYNNERAFFTLFHSSILQQNNSISKVLLSREGAAKPWKIIKYLEKKWWDLKLFLHSISY